MPAQTVCLHTDLRAENRGISWAADTIWSAESNFKCLSCCRAIATDKWQHGDYAQNWEYLLPLIFSPLNDQKSDRWNQSQEM